MTLSGRDRLDIAAVLHRYASCIDDRCPERLTEVFGDEADVNLGYGRWTDVAQVSAGIGAMIDGLSHSCHALSNIQLESDGADGAAATTYVTAWHWLSPEPNRPADFVMVGRYQDQLRRTPGGWRIVRRRAHAFGPSAVGVGTVPEVFQPGKESRS